MISFETMMLFMVILAFTNLLITTYSYTKKIKEALEEKKKEDNNG